jgi:hypothetical protein
MGRAKTFVFLRRTSKNTAALVATLTVFFFFSPSHISGFAKYLILIPSTLPKKKIIRRSLFRVPTHSGIARLSSDNLYCTCKYGFFGDGLNCTKREACAANALAGPFLSDPEAQVSLNFKGNFYPCQDLGEFEKPSRVCTGYHENSCCRLSADVFDPDVYLYVAGNDVCRSLLENFFCSLCDPGQTFLEFSSDYLIINVCADYCQQMFEACSSAYPADDESVPHQYLTTNYHEPFHFCEEALLKIFPFTNNSVVSLGVDARVNNKGECFSGAGRPSSSFVLLFGAVLVLILSELFITT